MTPAADAIRRWREEPTLFVRQCLKAEPDAWQCDVLAAYGRGAKRLALKASKGPGKTTVLAWIGWHFLTCFPHPKVVATSISGENLRDGLWAEMAKWQHQSPFLMQAFVWSAERIAAKEHPETWWAAARQWSKSADPAQQSLTLAGVHGDYVLFLVDESGGMPDGVVAAAEGGLATGKRNVLVQAGNPTHLSGPLYRACTTERALWEVFEISGAPEDPKRAPRVSIEWAREQIAKYGAEHDFVRINVFGKFPRQQSNTWISLDDVEGAVSRQLGPQAYASSPKVLGVDVSQGGEDESVIQPRQGDVAFPCETELGQPDTMKLVAHVCLVADAWSRMSGGPVAAIFVDANGVGAGVADRLRELGYPAYGVNSAEESHRTDVRFVNKRAQVWWDMARWLKSGAIPNDSVLRSQLTAPTYSLDAQGRYKLETKADMKKRGIGSPDRADALAYTFAMPVATKPLMPGMPDLAARTPLSAQMSCTTDFDGSQHLLGDDSHPSSQQAAGGGFGGVQTQQFNVADYGR